MTKTIFALFFFTEETVHGIFASPNETAIEPTIINFVLWLKLLVETMGAVIIAIGVILAIIEFGRTLLTSKPDSYTKIRLLLARYLALALEFQLGADILSTAISPSWNQIGKLGAIAIIRTALNFFLTREMEQEREITRNEINMDDNKN